MRVHPARIMSALKTTFDLSLDEAWESYRRLRVHLDRPVGLVDLTRHPRIVGTEVRAARLHLVGESARELERELDVRRLPRLVEAPKVYIEEYEEFELTADTAGET